MIEIWEPRYKDNVVLVACYKVTSGENKITFTKAKHLRGMVFSIDGEDIKCYPTTSNGKIKCYEVPMDALKRIS